MADQIYVAPIAAENDSGVKGIAVLTLSNDSLQVDVAATGLEPGQQHPMHIHGFSDGTPSDPTAASDTDGDGFLETPEGVLAIGPILLPLVQQGGTGTDNSDGGNGGSNNGGTGDNFVVADENGTVRFSETFTNSDAFVAQLLSGSATLEDRAVEIHGLTVDGNAGAGTPGEVDGTAGYKPLLPVGGGVIQPLSEVTLASLIGGNASGTVETGSGDQTGSGVGGDTNATGPTSDASDDFSAGTA
ncbi:hypothetical protein [Azospirillum soli]|uniref:hypothetical protein n=1 Tax=Azospirillum soli TaxID=1304799 RepID=UPI001AE953FE|nr:hypothetical protein [Azospirillum soli]MBP2312861.1 hypothetical protein [Azospirillum soli]